MMDSYTKEVKIIKKYGISPVAKAAAIGAGLARLDAFVAERMQAEAERQLRENLLSAYSGPVQHPRGAQRGLTRIGFCHPDRSNTYTAGESIPVTDDSVFSPRPAFAPAEKDVV